MGIFLTLGGWLAYVVHQIWRLSNTSLSVRMVIEAISYLGIVTVLTASATAYLLARLGFLYRARDHRRAPRVAIDEFFEESMPTLTVLVPSYREERRVVRQTLLSAALQEYPYMRLVLLVDDPPNPTDPEHIALLEQARALPGEIEALLAPMRRRFETALEQFEQGAGARGEADPRAMEALAGLYDEASDWFTAQAEGWEAIDHSDDFMVGSVLNGPAHELAQVAVALREAAADGAPVSVRRMRQLHRRLAWTFRAELTSFERKRYASLSHEANKAMNLNSYLGLMGGCYREEMTTGGLMLLEVRGDSGDLEIPDPDYVLTLDADSTLLPEYCLRLVHLMEQSNYADVAVAQTPYSAYPGAATRIERIAGATTDLQHQIHQGLTRSRATFWVGANAVLRKRALDDIRVEEILDGVRVRKYIQDRTPIEDTESSIDITLHGWELFNYPERLSYSATPPDFGSLCVQRQRWANGGLIVLPKLFSHLAADARRRGRFPIREALLRLNYLASICWSSIALVLLLAYPYSDDLLSPFALATAVPYFLAVASDLRRCKYKRTDLFRVYGLNLLLLPVNLAGVIQSLVQAVGGQKIAFARTPKVGTRTVAAWQFVVVPYLIVALSVWTLWRDVVQERYAHAAFASFNALLMTYAIVAFVGLRYSLVDLWLNLRERLYRRERRAAAQVADQPGWVSVLYGGASSGDDAGSVTPNLAAHVLMDQERDLQVVTTPVDLRKVGRPTRQRTRPARRRHTAAIAPAPAAPATGATSASDDAVQLLADALTTYLRMANETGRLTVRMDGGALLVNVESPAHENEDEESNASGS